MIEAEGDVSAVSFERVSKFAYVLTCRNIAVQDCLVAKREKFMSLGLSSERAAGQPVRRGACFLRKPNRLALKADMQASLPCSR